MAPRNTSQDSTANFVRDAPGGTPPRWWTCAERGCADSAPYHRGNATAGNLSIEPNGCTIHGERGIASSSRQAHIGRWPAGAKPTSPKCLSTLQNAVALDNPTTLMMAHRHGHPAEGVRAGAVFRRDPLTLRIFVGVNARPDVDQYGGPQRAALGQRRQGGRIRPPDPGEPGSGSQSIGNPSGGLGMRPPGTTAQSRCPTSPNEQPRTRSQTGSPTSSLAADPDVPAVPFSMAAKRAGVPLRTPRRWLTDYRSNGAARTDW